MPDLNHVILIGRLTRDAELKYTNGGIAVCKFSIAVNRKKKNGDQWVDEANFFDIVLWGRQGEALNQYLQKGKQIGVDGELRQERWQQDGQNRSRVEITANNIQLLGGGNNGSSNGWDGDNGNYGGGSNSGTRKNSYGSPSSGNGGWSKGTPQGQGRTRENEDSFTDDIPF
jgi:single-strand DNA-binding protein